MARYSTRPAVKTKSSATKSTTTTTTTTRIPVITSQSGRDSLKSSQSIEGGRLLTPGIARFINIFKYTYYKYQVSYKNIYWKRRSNIARYSIL